MFGRLVHEMIEAHAEGEDPQGVLDRAQEQMGKVFRSEREMYGDILEDISTIMREYFDFYSNSGVRYVRHKGRSAEHEFEVALTNRVTLTGKIDAIVRAKGLLWLKETKTFTKMPGEDERWRNVQTVVYFRAMQKLGWETPDGVLWDYVHSKPPTAPQVLKNGQLSKKQIITLPLKVKQVLKEMGERERDHKRLMEMAERGYDRYFHRVFTPIRKTVVDEVFRDFIATATEMEEGHGEKKDRNIDRHCSFCDFEPLCRAALQGLDVDHIREREYTIHEKPDKDDSTEVE